MLSDGAELALIDVREELIFSQQPSALGAHRAAEPAGAALRPACAAPRHPHRAVSTTATAWRSAPPKCWHAPATPTSPFSTAASPAWEKAGFELFSGVNVPSKAFGEHVEHDSGTPSISASELDALINSNADMVVVDSRPFDEYQRVSIPTATNVPGAELVLRIHDIAP